MTDVIDMQFDILELVEFRNELYKNGKNVNIDNVMFVSFGGYSKDCWGKKYGMNVCMDFNRWRDQNRDVVVLKTRINQIKIVDGKHCVCHRILVAYAPFTPVKVPPQEAAIGGQI